MLIVEKDVSRKGPKGCNTEVATWDAEINIKWIEIDDCELVKIERNSAVIKYLSARFSCKWSLQWYTWATFIARDNETDKRDKYGKNR